jgi:hypothetical protein
MKIYDIVVPKDNMLRMIKEMVDFSFVYEELESKYCKDNGRPADEPIKLFKYLLLKVIFDLSDVDIVERSQYDMSFKYFLDMTPEEGVIDPSTLSKFRKFRLQDTNLLDMLISKTVEIGIEKGIIKSRTIIVDATHSKSRYNQMSPSEALLHRAKELRKAVYEIDESAKDVLPKKIENGNLEDEIKYCQDLIETIELNETLTFYPKVKQKLNILKENIDDDLRHLELSKDEDAKVGHKTADSSFFGFKTHIAMTEERIITAAVVTSGEKHDGKQLAELVGKTESCGIEVQEVIGDTAYSEKDNLDYAKGKNIKLISKLHPLANNDARKKENEFKFNKDAGMYVCKQGHMAVRKSKHQRKNSKENPRMFYYFDIEKCKRCPQRDGCYKEGSKSKVYTVTMKSDIHKEQKEFQETTYFKTRAKERYMIESKNSELKNRHGYDRASASGLFGMEMQGALTIFAVNMKRIIKLLGQN